MVVSEAQRVRTTTLFIIYQSVLLTGVVVYQDVPHTEETVMSRIAACDTYLSQLRQLKIELVSELSRIQIVKFFQESYYSSDAVCVSFLFPAPLC